MHITTICSIPANDTAFNNTTGIHWRTAAHRSTSRGASVALAGARHSWIADMNRPLTERSTNAAKLDVPLPQGFQSAFQHLVEGRNQAATQDRKRIYARDLYEEAIGELVQAASVEHLTFIATPFRGFVRKMFWVDQPLKRAVERIALDHGITRSAVVLTAFHRYLDRHDVLQDYLKRLSPIGS